MLPLLLIAIACLAVLGSYTFVVRERYLREHSKIEDYKACIEELESQLEQQETRNQLVENVESLTTQAEILITRKAKLDQECSNLEARKGSLEESLTQLEQTHTALQRQLENVRSQLAQLQSQYDTLQRDCQQLDQDKMDRLQQFHLLETNQQNLQAQVQSLQSQKTTLERTCDRLNTVQAEIEAENQKLEEKHYELMDQDKTQKNIQKLVQDNQGLTQQINQLQNELSHCQTAKPQHLQRIHIVSGCEQHNSHNLVHAELDTDFKRVIEALEFAEILFGDVLDIWESARSSAYSSNFIRPADVYRSLQSFAWFSKDYFRKNGELGTSFYQALQQYQLDYSSESETTQNKPKALEQRRFWDGDRNKIMLNHLKLGGGNGADNILRIYFDLNLETQRAEIGHCGRHL